MCICHYEIKEVDKQDKHGLSVVIVWFWYLKANARRVRYKLVLICYIIKRWEVSRNKPLLKRWKVTPLLLVILAQINRIKNSAFSWKCFRKFIFDYVIRDFVLWGKIFKNRTSVFVEESLWKVWSDMVHLSRTYYFKFF